MKHTCMYYEVEDLKDATVILNDIYMLANILFNLIFDTTRLLLDYLFFHIL